MHRILVLDDDEIFRDLLEMLLSGDNTEATFCSSLDEAVREIAISAPFEVVLTDLRMPGLEPDTLARTLRSALPRGTTLLAMSATKAAAETESLFDGFISKPFDLQLLRDAVEVARRKTEARDLALRSDRAAAGNATGTASEVLDEAIFGSLQSMISPPQLRELFAMALKDIGKRHDRMLEAATAEDLPALQHEAHAVKGSCGMMGAVELQKLAASLETGTILDRVALEEIPQACHRLQRILDSKFPH